MAEMKKSTEAISELGVDDVEYEDILFADI